MSWIRALFQLALVSAHVTATAAEKITWASCEINSTLPIQCGTLSVPLDYSSFNPEPSDATLDLQLLKVPALHTPRKGSILFNFGGPGVPGRPFLASKAELLQALTGGYYDLIAQDPRGTGNTLAFSCFESDQARTANFSSFRFTELAGPEDKMPLGRLWASASVLAETCYGYADSRRKGELISTAFTARDVMQIVDAVEDDGLLRYWGFSYGTVLGSTIAAMFPDRMDRVILDGVMNPHEYYHSYDIEKWADTDMVFSNFFKRCIESPDTCALAARNTTSKTAANLEKSVYNLLDDIKYHPIAHEGGIFIDHGLVKGLILSSLNSPTLWPILSTGLDLLLAGDIARFLKTLEAVGGGLSSDLNEILFGIPCSEKKPPNNDGSFRGIFPTLRTLDETSTLLGQTGDVVAMTCSQWKSDAKERYEGDFRVETKHPMLVIGNTYDPTTPLRSARNISAGFEGSVLLEHGGYGHTSQEHGSVCTGNAIRNYFMDGSLPAPGTVCEPAYPPFANKTWVDILPEIETGSK